MHTCRLRSLRFATSPSVPLSLILKAGDVRRYECLSSASRALLLSRGGVGRRKFCLESPAKVYFSYPPSPPTSSDRQSSGYRAAQVARQLTCLHIAVSIFRLYFAPEGRRSLKRVTRCFFALLLEQSFQQCRLLKKK